MNPKIRVTVGKGQRGVLLERLANVANDTAQFLVDLGEDLGLPATHQWIAENFRDGSVVFDLENPAIDQSQADTWRRGLRTVMANDLTDEINVRIRYRTRQKFAEIAKHIDQNERIEFALYSADNGSITETFELVSPTQLPEVPPTETSARYHGEIQGIIHSFLKESKHPKLVLRELATKQLVNCFFSREMYPHAVALLEDENAVVMVEGLVTEDANTGLVTDVQVSEFTPCPEFDLAKFENMIGAFPKTLTGGEDSAELLDEYRDE
jgi:hypothetical protein